MTFHSLQWTKTRTNDDDVIRLIRRDVRKFRREKGRAGHRFNHAKLKNCWHVEETHAVINHTDDPLWQYWYNHPQDGWTLVHWYSTRREAQAAAELPHPEAQAAVDRTVDGLYVKAGWSMDDYTMRVTCASRRIAEEIQGVFRKLGCVTTLGDTRLPDADIVLKDVDTSLSSPNFDDELTSENVSANA